MRRVADNTDVFTENTEQSAEEVMNAYLEALRDLDIDGMRSLMVGAAREDLGANVPMLSERCCQRRFWVFLMRRQKR